MYEMVKEGNISQKINRNSKPEGFNKNKNGISEYQLIQIILYRITNY